MTREEVQRKLSERRSELAEMGVRSLDIFGSVARGESGPGSDVDLLVEFDRPIGLFYFFRVQNRLAQILDCPLDLVMREAVKPQLLMREAVKPQLRDRIFLEAIRAT
jgi:uncharacterized protein